MKKLGTPIGDGPGSDSEKVGLLALGTPLPEGRLLGFLVFFLEDLGFAFALCLADPVVDGDWGWEEGFCPWPFPLGPGVVDDRVVDELEDEVEVEPGVVDEVLEEPGVVLEEVVLDELLELEELVGSGSEGVVLVVEVEELLEGVQD